MSSCGTFVVDTSRTAVLSLYRRLLKEGSKLPTVGQRAFVKSKTRVTFRELKSLTSTEEIEFNVRLAHTHIDNIRATGKHLKKYFYDDRVEEKKEQQKDELKKGEEMYKKLHLESWKTGEEKDD